MRGFCVLFLLFQPSGQDWHAPTWVVVKSRPLPFRLPDRKAVGLEPGWALPEVGVSVSRADAEFSRLGLLLGSAMAADIEQKTKAAVVKRLFILSLFEINNVINKYVNT